LGPNSSINGSIRYVFGSVFGNVFRDANYSSFEVICRLRSEQKPLFIIPLNP
jgi:hypothetical protein